MAQLSLTEKAILQGRKNKLKQFNLDAFKRNQLLLYILTDLIDGMSTDLITQMKAVGVYEFEDKQAIDIIKKKSSALVRDVDQMCTRDYSCTYGEMSDAVRTLITAYLKNKRTLEHE